MVRGVDVSKPSTGKKAGALDAVLKIAIRRAIASIAEENRVVVRKAMIELQNFSKVLRRPQG